MLQKQKTLFQLKLQKTTSAYERRIKELEQHIQKLESDLQGFTKLENKEYLLIKEINKQEKVFRMQSSWPHLFGIELSRQ